MPCLEPKCGPALPRDVVGPRKRGAHCAKRVVRVGQELPDQTLDFDGQVIRGARSLVSGQDAEHGAGDQSLRAEEVAPGLVWAVAAFLVGPDTCHTFDEKREFEVWPLGEEVLPVF